MNVLSCGGVCRRIMLACSGIVLVYLILFHPDDRPPVQYFQEKFHSPTPGANRHKLGAPHSVTKKVIPLTCTNNNRIVFLKTHKTASSTVQNILMRYGTKHEKTFALPITGKTIFKYWKPWNGGDYYKLSSGMPPDMIVHHMRFSPDVVKVFGDENTFYFSILRNPVQMFESLFNYMKHVAPQFKKAGHLETFLDDPEKYRKIGSSKSMTSFFSKNHMTFEFGFNPLEEDETKIDLVIQQIEKRFNFILINEYMAESLIVLKRYLCMTLEDIACFITNARKSTSKLSESSLSKIEEWNKADYRLYKFFNASLWEKIEEIGFEQVEEEKEELESFVGILTNKCVKGYFENKDLTPDFKVYQQPGVKVLGIKLTDAGERDELCYAMARPEFPWTESIMKRQGQSVKTLNAFSKT